MQVKVGMKCMENNFDGSLRFLRFCLPSKTAKFPFGPWTIIVYGGQKIESPQNIHASKDMQAEMQVHAQSLVGVASPFLEILPNVSTSQK